MPVFRLETNLPKSKIPPGFLDLTTALMAKILGKPQSYCVATVIPDQAVSWGGSLDPCGIASFSCIGRFGVEENKKHTAVLHEHVEKHLGIPKDRLYITFCDLNAAEVGYKGTTFHEIFTSDKEAM